VFESSVSPLAESGPANAGNCVQKPSLNQGKIGEFEMLKKKGFTLIELLVVIAIIALLLSIILPSLKKVKNQAKAMICMSNCKQWMSVTHMYLNDHNNTFWYDGPDMLALRQGLWMETLSSYIGETDDFRLCPSAKKLTFDAIDTANGFKHGSTFEAWDARNWGGFDSEKQRNYGSYGINLWLSPALGIEKPGWGNMGDFEKNKRDHWGKADASNTSNIPILGDSAWFGAEPLALSTGGRMGEVPMQDDDCMMRKAGVTDLFPRIMSRLCINRHEKHVNWGFMDGSCRKVKLNDLWSLQWHRKYEKAYDVDIPWLK